MCQSPSACCLARVLGTHLEDHRQEVHREASQVHHASGAELLLQLFAGFLVGCFPEYSFGEKPGLCGLEQLGKTPWLKENIAVFPEHGRTFFGGTNEI